MHCIRVRIAADLSLGLSVLKIYNRNNARRCWRDLSPSRASKSEHPMLRRVGNGITYQCCQSMRERGLFKIYYPLRRPGG